MYYGLACISEQTKRANKPYPFGVHSQGGPKITTSWLSLAKVCALKTSHESLGWDQPQELGWTAI